MPSKYSRFDRDALRLLPLSERRSLLGTDVVAVPAASPHVHPAFERVAEALGEARRRGAARILMLGAHVLRSGMQRYLFDLMEQGYIDCVAVNGACAIHDFEFALAGRTTECVATYITQGQFGLWRETGRLNDIVAQGVADGLGFGEAVGRHILESGLPHADLSLFARAYALDIPVTVHVGIGYDIVHEHPNCDGAALGRASYDDFLIFAHAVQRLEHGAVMNFGSAVMAPEVYLKALAMARNADQARGDGQGIRRFTTLVCDMHELPEDFGVEAPRTSAGYYFRPWKTMLVRTVADGGRSYYVRGLHAQTIPQLWTALNGG